ncbi:NAD(P)/FAD-dependent oxidoreductase [Desulfitobacterium sp.]|uniref:NAD(P)/FAD-dependent oxidoreductase n=1 Tax=Desulfitobacterium sp. TaxID=49981 RepID=UPI002B203ECD|nr:NAD(P)/FAD-dependent oxidoreductase [Desulfitobacterium sp.]MEA4901593.1 NAD(P)/FAD-dependent oxidoreductase [Desulfitobacterium sp.]
MKRKASYDIVVVGAGPAGSTAARVAGENGAKVLLLEKRSQVGSPVQCAEHIPEALVHHVNIQPEHIAQPVSALETYLPNGDVHIMPARGYILHRNAFDKYLAVSANKAGAHLWVGARALRPSSDGLIVIHQSEEKEIGAKIIIGADGPGSTVGHWMDQVNQDFLVAAQVEVVLDKPIETAKIYFHSDYVHGYGWVFPKGTTANIGVGLSAGIIGSSQKILDRFLKRLGYGRERVVSQTAGIIPVGGPLKSTCSDRYLLVGDAAGQTHSITGAGIANAILCGEMAGRAAAKTIQTGNRRLLGDYEKEWRTYLGRSLQRAVNNRQYQKTMWTNDQAALSALIQETWIAFPNYTREKAKN